MLRQPQLAVDAGGMSDEVRILPVPGLVRRVRRLADLSQRDLARALKVSPSTIARIEDGTRNPSILLLERILDAAGLVLVAADVDGRVVLPMEVFDDRLDGANRRYPAHLDLILDPDTGEWWGDRYGLARPPETFHRDRAERDAQRRRSQWEVRVAKYRYDPPPAETLWSRPAPPAELLLAMARRRRWRDWPVRPATRARYTGTVGNADESDP